VRIPQSRLRDDKHITEDSQGLQYKDRGWIDVAGLRLYKKSTLS
jgi:hypothetical protein